MTGKISISPFDKAVSIISYITMGMAGLIYLIFAFLTKKNTKYFLMYNIAQSMLISVFLAIFSIIFDIIFRILSMIPLINYLVIKINLYLSKTFVSFLGLSFNIIQFLVFIILVYIIAGIVSGRIFYIPILSNIMNKVMKSYK